MAPLFSVYSKESLGIGDFGDLKLLIELCNKSGLSVIQLLPLNTLGVTFCPYDAISSFALEPAYLSLRLLPGPYQKIAQESINQFKQFFPANSAYVDYGVKAAKMNLLWEIFSAVGFTDSGEFQEFRRSNSYWLDDFTLFALLKQHHQDKAWYEWGEVYRNRDVKSLDEFRLRKQKEITFLSWVQWQLYEQFKNAKAYAQAKNVLIKGDLPFLVARDSADAWAHPEFFKLDFASGAPPDVYCAGGQRWGMPPYDWEKISNDGYRYLKERLRYAQNFYDILRIDHVVGLFRIWSIPYNEPVENQGLNGFFDPLDESKWGRQGAEILSVMLNSAGMLLCAEDLGVIPKACTETLEKLGLPGNDVQRWVKDWKIKHDFLSPRKYRLLSVAMLSTHDTTNWLDWWENEAGTVDAALFMKKCRDRGIDYAAVKDKLFDAACCGRDRLCWSDSVSCVDILLWNLGKRKGEVMDFVDMYVNSYREKEKLWKHLKLAGPLRQNSDAQILSAALKFTLSSNAIFCIETIIDWLGLGGVLKTSVYPYRINTPGVVSPKNWSLRIPIALEDLLKHKVCVKIKELVSSSGRI